MPALCVKCKNMITPTVQSIKCAICAAYYHIRCVDITKNQLDLIRSTPGFFWKCPKCSKSTSASVSNNKCDCCDIIPHLKEVIDKLSATVESLKNQLSQKTPSDIGLEDIIREVNERQLRKSNLIFYGFDELPQHTPASERKIKDRTLVTDFLAFLEITGDDTVTDLDCFRLGKYDVNRSRPRPIKV